MKYDYIVVGAGLAGCTFARLAKDKGKKVLIVEKSNSIGGTCSTKSMHGIIVHEYGAHIFKTNDNDVWKFVNKYDEFVPFVNTPKALYYNEIYSLPINMNTFHELWNVNFPTEAKEEVEKQRKKGTVKNLEDFVLTTVGIDIYKKLIKDYTEKQWGVPCNELSPEIMRRIPIRFTYDNNYYNEKYQGIPKHGYSYMLEKMVDGIDIIYGVDFIKNKRELSEMADVIVYSGSVDELLDYKYGILQYRSLKFEHRYYPNEENVQGVAVINHTSKDKPYTRTIEHKNFIKENGSKGTVITTETPEMYNGVNQRYYPINDEKNKKLYKKYVDEIGSTYILIGRLGFYKYIDMSETIKMTKQKFEEVENG